MELSKVTDHELAMKTVPSDCSGIVEAVTL